MCDDFFCSVYCIWFLMWVCRYLPSISRWVMFNWCPSHHIEHMRWRQLAWNLWFLVSAPKSGYYVYFTNNLLFITTQNRFIFLSKACKEHDYFLKNYMYIFCEKSITAIISPRNTVLVNNVTPSGPVASIFSTYKNKNFCDFKRFHSCII